MRASLGLLSSLAVAMLLAQAPSAVGSPPRISASAAVSAGPGPMAWRDTVLPRTRSPRAHRSTAIGYGGVYAIGKARIRVISSLSWGNDDAAKARRKSWASFFGSLPHGSEINLLTLYVLPLDEMQKACGAAADSCYDPNESAIYLIGETPPDGANINQIAAHEYGHHIATHRDNRPWDASTWGPKFWASARGVCLNTRTSRNAPVKRKVPLMWPGDEGAHYNDNPSEVWAETYRIIASQSIGQTPDPWQYDPKHDPPLRGLGLNDLWQPNALMLAAARRDVLRPWAGGRLRTWTDRFGRGRPTVRNVRVPLSLDGRVSASLRADRGMSARLQLFAADGRALTGRTGAGRRVSLRNDVCGERFVTVRVTGRGSGRWRVAVSDPGS